MRLRVRLTAALLGAHVLLTLVAAGVAWSLLDAGLRQQAEDRARAVGAVLAGGGFTPNAAVLSRMQALAGAEFRFVHADDPPVSGTVRVAEGGRMVEVSYRTAAYRAARREMLLAVVLVAGFGLILVVAVSWALARSVARPLERLADAARRIGGGDLATPVAAVGSGEPGALAADLEAMRARLADLERRTRDAERLAVLGTFSATVAHEVRNPLSAVRLTIQLLGRRLPGETQLAVLGQELERLDLIVDELLAYARGMTVNREPVDLAAAATSVVSLLQRQADHAGVAVAVSGAGRANADPMRLRQMLLNLVLNGIQAVQSGGRGGTVSVQVADGRLVVADDGPGLDPVVADRLGRPFATTRADGTGLGLHLAAAVATAHGGSLTHQAGDPGARFVVTLP